MSLKPLEWIRGKYEGPGAPEWALGLMAVVLLGADLTARLGAETVQSAVRYYFRVPGVTLFQGLGIGVDLLVTLSVVGWLVWPRYKAIFQKTLLVACLVGPPVVWGEIVLAMVSQRGAVYVLDAMPFRPVNNNGIVGSSTFWLYTVGKQFFSKTWWLDLLAKLACALVVVGGQMLVYQWLAARYTR